MDGVFGWAGLAAVGALLVSAWGYLRGLASQLITRVIIDFECRESACDAVLFYCNHILNRSRFGPAVYVGHIDYVRPMKRNELVAFETPGGNGKFYWMGWRPLFIKRISGGNPQNDQSDTTTRPIVVYTLRFWFDRDQFVLNAMDALNALLHDTGGVVRPSRRFQFHYHTGTAGQMMVNNDQAHASPSGPPSRGDYAAMLARRYLRWKIGELGPAQSSNALSTLALGEQALRFLNTVRGWLASRDWFIERGLPWKLGALFYGIPGCGKTATVRAMAEEFDLPVHVFSLATMRDRELQRYWRQMLADLPAIALIEDIDGVYIGREPAVEGIELSFNCLLNCIDGVERAEGLLVIITTNKPETLDDALGGAALVSGEMSARPGRVDIALEFGKPSEEGKLLIANRILHQWPEELEKVMAAGANDTGAQFERRCLNIAQDRILAEGFASSADANVPGLLAEAGFGRVEIFPAMAEARRHRDRILDGSKFKDRLILRQGAPLDCAPPAAHRPASQPAEMQKKANVFKRPDGPIRG